MGQMTVCELIRAEYAEATDNPGRRLDLLKLLVEATRDEWYAKQVPFVGACGNAPGTPPKADQAEDSAPKGAKHK